MSKDKIRDFQIDLCDPEKPPERERVCPSCIPNPNAIVPDWKLSEGQPFLNEQLCEYQVAVFINQYGDFNRAQELRELSDGGIDLDTILQSYVLPGLRIMLRYYEKEEDDSLVCAFPPDNSGYTETMGYADTATHVVQSAAIGFLWGGPVGG